MGTVCVCSKCCEEEEENKNIQNPLSEALDEELTDKQGPKGEFDYGRYVKAHGQTLFKNLIDNPDKKDKNENEKTEEEIVKPEEKEVIIVNEQDKVNELDKDKENELDKDKENELDKEEGNEKDEDLDGSVDKNPENNEEDLKEVNVDEISSEEIKTFFIELQSKNKIYEANKSNGTMEGDKNYKIIAGNQSVILTAPNAVKQTREKKIRNAEIMTGAIVDHLCSSLNLFGVIRTCNQNDDPSYYGTGLSLEFKKQIKDLITKNNIKFLFDIHGTSDDHGYDINIGIDDGNNLTCDRGVIDEIKKILEKKFKVDVDNVFKAHSKNTISKYIHTKCNITCIQFELSKKVRTQPEPLNDFCQLFNEVLQYLNTTNSA